MADTSLIFNIIARDKTTATLEKIRANAASTGAVIGRVLGPAVVPALAVAAGGALALGAAFAAAGAGAGVFGAVAKTAMTEITESATKYEDLTDKIALYGKEAEIQAARGEDNAKSLKKQADAQLELQARLKLLPPAQRAATEGYLDLKESWMQFVDSNKPATYSIFATGFQLLGQGIKRLQPFFDAGANAAKKLLAAIAPVVTGSGLDTLASRAGPALDTLTKIIINVGKAVGRTFGAFASDGQGILDWIEQATAKWAAFSDVKTGGGLQKFVDYFHAQGPGVISMLGNLASAAVHIAQAVSPLAPISMAVASALSALVAAMPPGVITALVAGWIAYGVAIKAYAVGSAIMTAAQWAQNSAFLASPITWIILAVVALVAGIVLLATKTKFFQTIWDAVWGFMKKVGAWFAGPFADFFVMLWHKIVSAFVSIKNGIASAINAVKAKFQFWAAAAGLAKDLIVAKFTSVVNFIKNIPGKIKGALSNMFSPLWSGFKGFINRIIGGWNSLHFGIPGFSFAGISVPGVSIGVPRIPYLARGGTVLEQGLAFIHRGETVTPAAKVTPYRSGSDGAHATITLKSDGSRLMNLLLEILREAIRERGGDVVKVLSPG